MLAQLGTTDKSFWTAVLYLAALVLFMGIAAAVIAVIRKRLRQKDEASGIGLTLADVRQWQVAGKVSPEEGEELKRAILESLKSQPRRDGSK